MTDLFSPVRYGRIEAKNRVVMAPLTRSRADDNRVPNDLMALYYAQRASAGLIVSEATAISPQGYGWGKAPAIYTNEQIEGWETITKAVHDKGGKIVLQLWHMGSLSHSFYQENNDVPVAPSPVQAEGIARGMEVEKPYEVPRALTIDEIKATVHDYAQAATNAIKAGFDGVEIHGANGYLIDQFLKDKTNLRDDEYGGSFENRARFLFEVLEAVCNAIGADRTGLRLSPNVPNGGISDKDPAGLFAYLAPRLNDYNLAFVHIHEGLRDGGKPAPWVSGDFRKQYNGPLILNGNYDRDAAMAALQNNEADAMAFGKAFISNPDLVERLKANAPLNEPDTATFYAGGEKGYTDYPAMK